MKGKDGLPFVSSIPKPKLMCQKKLHRTKYYFFANTLKNIDSIQL